MCPIADAVLAGTISAFNVSGSNRIFQSPNAVVLRPIVLGAFEMFGEVSNVGLSIDTGFGEFEHDRENKKQITKTMQQVSVLIVFLRMHHAKAWC